MALALLLWATVGSVSGFTVGGGSERTQTRSMRRLGTKSYVGSVPRTERAAKVDDASEGRWFPWSKEVVQKSTQEAPVSADEQAVDEYLEFLDRRYR